MPRTVEIAGAGFAGLMLGSLLAERGWTARVHEASPEVREIGAGIFIHNNGLAVLQDCGLMELLASRGERLTHDRMVDGQGTVLQDRRLRGDSTIWSFPREALIQAIKERALHTGVEIVAGSRIDYAKPDGALVDITGQVHKADLVVGADGHRSAVRNSLGITEQQQELTTFSLRFLLHDREFTPEPVTTENWSGRRRIALAACGPQHTYVYLACPADDLRGSTIPIDVDSWSSSFPRLRTVFERLHRHPSHKSHYCLVRCSRWSRGQAVVVGDAAHALAPTLGQGTNLALSNVRSLVTELERISDIRSALQAWEANVRPVVESTQRWAALYDSATKRWPDSLQPIRNVVISAFGTGPLERRLRRADRTPPILS